MSGFRREKESCRRIVMFGFLACMLLISGCATTSVLLDMNTLSIDEIRKAEVRESKFNTVRFEVLGGANHNLFYYVLYTDGFEVRTSGPLKNMGKMTLREAQSNYDKDRHSLYFSRQSRAKINEVIREGSVIGYTLFNEEADVELWEDTTQTDKSKVILILNYEDLRMAD